MDSGSPSLCSPGRNDARRAPSKSICIFAALLALCVPASAASAQDEVRVGVGFGLALLPAYMCEDLKLVEKQGKAAHLELKATYKRFFGAGPAQEAIAADAIDIAPFGTAPLLAAWEKAKDTPQQNMAVSGLTTLSLVRPDVRTLGDFRAADRIAIPTATAPQLYFLQMQSEKVFCQYDKLHGQVVVMPHPDALADLLSGKGPVAGYFSSEPFTEIALADGRVHKVLGGADIVDGKATFLILGATKGYVDAHPTVPEAVIKAMDEAARIINDDPRRAAAIYLAHEPSKTLDARAPVAVVSDTKEAVGSTLQGVAAFAEFMGATASSKRSWKDILAPALLNSPNT